MATQADEGGFETLHVLKSVDPPLWLAPSQDLSHTARTASAHLFSRLRTFCPKSPFDRLLVEGFDAEQIWQQIDLQSQPLVSSLKREMKRFEKNPSEIFGEKKSDELKGVSKGLEREIGEVGVEDEGGKSDEEVESEDMEGFDDDDDDEGVEEGSGGVEDKFLKIKDLEEYLEEGEAKEFGFKKSKGGRKVYNEDKDTEDEEGDEDEDDDDDEDDELGIYGGDVGNENEGPDKLGSARYEDFFGTKKKKVTKRNLKRNDGSDVLGSDEELADDKKKEVLSTHEKELLKLRAKIDQMEKATLEPKNWTMQGEVTAAKRPRNSALEVDLDFEHNVRPPPVITEEVTASLEDLIRGRILEGNFNDVQKVPSLPSKAPKEVKEMDENKSKKGLAEVYEEEYVQTTGLASGPLSFSDEQKKEASMLFKRLCLKLDALSHFHFSPKPVIEDMSVHANVPALAFEEVAPVMVSDAAMLAPEEVFAGKGDIKEETELTKADRKRRRATKKRKFKSKAAKRIQNKPRDTVLPNQNDGLA